MKPVFFKLIRCCLVLVTATAAFFLASWPVKPVSKLPQSNSEALLATPVPFSDDISVNMKASSPSPSLVPVFSPSPSPIRKTVPEWMEYKDGVSPGTVRYVSQLKDVEENGWGKYSWKAGMECTTACISMALSYLGIDESPEALLDFSSTTIFQSCYGLDEQISVSPFGSLYYTREEATEGFFNMFSLYWSDTENRCSPILIYLAGNGHNHAVLAVGIENGQYLVLDPTPAGIHRIHISETGEITTDEEMYLSRYTADGTEPAVIQSIAQWILKDTSSNVNEKSELDS